MPKRQRAISEFRNVILNNGVSQIAAPIDANFAMLDIVEKIEGRYDIDPTSVTDLAGATVLNTGRRNDQIHLFTVTTTVATGIYSIAYVETKPNAVA